jgi:Pentapeptide repeats (9 copies)
VATAKTREELEADWWKNWWQDDFSWDGLARKPIAGAGGIHGERTLQDYWLRDPATGKIRSVAEMEDAGEFKTAPDGNRWHIAHVPLFWHDGSPAKSGWGDPRRAHLAAIIAARMATAQKVAVADGRAQLQGNILLDPPPIYGTIHIVAAHCRLPAWHAGPSQLGSDTDFNKAYFLGDAHFNAAEFLGNTRFDNAIFLGVAWFDHAKLSGHANFDSATFSGDAGFDSTIFNGHASFNNCHFADGARFDGTVFLSDTHFNRATFPIGARFDSATFSRYASFEDASFSDNACFKNAKFLGGAGFDSATFSREAGFSSAKFLGDANFTRVSFSGDASFERAIFLGAARFNSARLQKSASFGKVRFEVKDGEELKSGRMTFGKAVFSGPTDFEGAVFATRQTDHSAAFHEARFDDRISFRDCGDHWVAALDEAEIIGRIQIDPRSEAESLRDFDEVVLARARADGNNKYTGVSLLKELEGGCRTVKVAMGAVRNDILEQRFYRFELKARQHKVTTPWFEQRASQLYGWVADYGLSPTRPLIALFAVVVTSAVLLLGLRRITTGQLQSGSDLLSAVSLSLGRVFPFGAFESVSNKWFEGFTQGHQGWEFLVRSLATLESLLALFLVFLFGLALRRRFQIG